MLSVHSKAHVDCVSRVLKNAAHLPQLPVPDLILDSWRRSMEQHHLDPGSLQGPRILSHNVLQECRERSELFLRIASEEVARLHGRVRDADYCVLLTDAQGQTIDYRVESTIRNDCQKAGLYLGTCWSEGEEGTCGVAAVLTARTPVTVHKRDHFRAAFIGLTCSAAPVFDPQGELLGVLDVSAVRSPDERRSQHLIRQMVVQSAREIEQAFFMNSVQGYWVLRAHRSPGYVDSQPDYLLAWDDDGRLQALNPAARQWLLHGFGRLPEHIGQVFDQAQLQAARDESLCLLHHQAGTQALHGRLSAPRRSNRSRQRLVLSPAELDPRLAESLRLALADERRILNADLEQMLAKENLANPIFGLTGAHLLLLEHERDRYRDVSKLDAIVRNLQQPLGATHPDWVALALQCSKVIVPRNVVLDGPPMFARSWPLLVRAAHEGRIEIPAAMWSRMQAPASLPPFMAWSIDEGVKRAALETLRQALLEPPSPVMAMAMNMAPAHPVSRHSRARLARARKWQLPPSALDLLPAAPP